MPRVALQAILPAVIAASALSVPHEALARKKQEQSGGGLFGLFNSSSSNSNNNSARSTRNYNYRSRYDDDGDGRRSRSADTPRTKVSDKIAVVNDVPVKHPLVIVVSLAQQKLTVFDPDGPIADAPVSSGQPAFPTLTGVFTILEKSVVHHSNLYGEAPMPFMERLTYSGTALHAGELPGYPASHGCVRLPHNFAKKLYGMTQLGTRVIVARNPIPPRAVSHPNLIQPLPFDTAEPQPLEVAGGREYESVFAMMISTARAERAAKRASPGPQHGSTVTAADLEGLSGWRLKRSKERYDAEQTFNALLQGKAEAEAAHKAALAEAERTRGEAKKAALEVTRLGLEERKAEQARINGDKALADFAKRYADDKRLSSEEVAKAAQTEQQLEDATFALGNALAVARQATASGKAAAAAADAAANAAFARTKETPKAIAKVIKEVKAAEAVLDEMRRMDEVRKNPVSVYISRSLGRMFVRQGYVPIFDVPVTINEPTAAIGTHVFTALDLTTPTQMRWSVASIPYDYTGVPASEVRARAKDAPIVEPKRIDLPQTPEAALDRITIPDEARERIADVLKPGSSIVISDYGMSQQTGPYSDFIVMTRQ